MIPFALRSLWLVPLLAVAPAAAQGEAFRPGDFDVPEGLEVSLWAESPLLYNPTAMDVDPRGRVWVTEAVNYRTWGGRNPGRRHEEGDRVVILEDTDGDGKADSSKVFVEDPDLVAPLGICVLPDWGDGRGVTVLVSASPNLWRYVDADGDDVPETRELLLTGFGGPDHDHGLHSLVPHVDGWLYGAVGNAGPHIVRDRSGWTLRSGSLYAGGGPASADNRPGLSSDDGRVWTGGLVFRLRPDGTGLEVLAHNFRNQYEVAVDAFGNLFTADNDDDGNASCRTLWVLEGGNHGYFSADGSRRWSADRRPGQDTPTAHWHRDDPGVVPSGRINGAGGPTGVVVYEGELLDGWIQGAVLNCDAGARVVYAHRPRSEGAGLELEAGELLRARGEGRSAAWFRPSDVTVGLAGEVLVSDWFDPGVGGHAMGDREAYGRILRVAPRGHAAPRSGVRSWSEALDSPAPSVRSTAHWAAARHGAEAMPAKGGAPARARGLTAGDPEGLAAGLADPDPRVRAACVRALRRHPSWPAPLGRILEDRDPGVLREAALGLRDLPLEAAREPLFELAEALDPTDRIALEALGIGVGERAEELWPDLVERFGEVPARWDARFEALAWRLHPEAAVPSFLARALDGGLSPEARRRTLDALAFVKTPAAADAMVAAALGGPQDLQAYAWSWVQHRATNDWAGFGLEGELEGDFGAAERLFASAVVRSGDIPVRVDLQGASTLWLVATDGGNGNGYDWADWIEPRLTGPAGSLELQGEPFLEATTQWGSVNVGRNAAGGPLVVDGRRRTGIGVHAASRLGFQVPAGYTHLEARAGIDDGGRDQPGSTSSVVFEVWVERAEAEPELKEEERLVRDPFAPSATRAQAARVLAEDPRGGLFLLRLAERGELDESLRPTVAAAIFENPDLGVRALASEHFTRPGYEGRELPSVGELLALEGDADRGRELFQTERAQCLRCHSMTRNGFRRGGNIGPDLSAVHRKLGRAEILDAVLNPSANLSFGYDTWLVEDVDGRLYSGFLIADGASLVLKDTQGARHVIPRDEVADRVRQEVSTMPQGVALGLGAEDIADLVAFLAEDPTRTPRLGEEVVLFDGVSLAGWTHYLGDPKVGAGDVWSVADGVLTCRGRPAGYLRTRETFENFVLTLEWRFDPEKGAGNSGVLLRVHGEDKVWPRSIEAQLQAGNAGDLWNIDRFGMEVDGARTRGRHTKRLEPSSERPLGEWNRYVIVLDGGRLRLEVNGVLQNEAAWCEDRPGWIALQSEGAEIQFRDIRLTPILR